MGGRARVVDSRDPLVSTCIAVTRAASIWKDSYAPRGRGLVLGPYPEEPLGTPASARRATLSLRLIASSFRCLPDDLQMADLPKLDVRYSAESASFPAYPVCL